jgi:uncharacterized protein
MAVLGQSKGQLVLAVKARPTAGRNRVIGIVNDELIVAVAAPPIDGKASAELLRFLARTTGVRVAEIAWVSGERARHKLLAFPPHASAALQVLINQANALKP